ncbi:MAG: hypothetical protein L3J71_03625 [Victivallaceae bacterium]|nr:hypothetical protein [Victivallaceae bacterium]
MKAKEKSKRMRELEIKKNIANMELQHGYLGEKIARKHEALVELGDELAIACKNAERSQKEASSFKEKCFEEYAKDYDKHFSAYITRDWSNVKVNEIWETDHRVFNITIRAKI